MKPHTHFAALVILVLSAGLSAAAQNPPRHTPSLFSGFVQDELALVPNRLRLTVGLKLERHSQDGLQAQPNLRLLWTPTPPHGVWAGAQNLFDPRHREFLSREGVLSAADTRKFYGKVTWKF